MKVPLTEDFAGDTGANTMTIDPATNPSLAASFGRRISGGIIAFTIGRPVRLLGVIALAHIAVLVGDLDETTRFGAWVDGVIVAVAAVAMAAIVNRTRGARRLGVRFLLVVYGVWWLALGFAVVVNQHLSPSDGFLPALVFVGGFDSFGKVSGAFVLTSLIVVGFLRQRGPSTTPATLDAKRRLAIHGALGALLLGRPVVDLLARQHVERVTLDEHGVARQLVGPQLPLFVWTVISVVALGTLIGPAVEFLGRRFVLRDRRAPTFMMLWVSATSLAFVVRLFTLLTVAPTRTDAGDPLFYHSTANLLARGLGFPEPLNFIAHQRWFASALHGPMYPIVLSLSSRFGGTTFFDHKMLSLVIGTAVVASIGVLARLLSPRDNRVVILAMVIGAVYPNLWIVDSVLFPEGLMALFTTLTLVCAHRWESTPARRWAVAMGLLTGLAALTRGEGLLLAVLLIVPLIIRRRDIAGKRRLAHIAWAAVACIVVIAPWAIRNERSFDSSVPLSTNGNELFVYANCDATYSGKFLGFWSYACQEDLRDQGIDATGDEADKALFWRKVGIDYAREHAGQLPKVIAARVGRQWELFRPMQNVEFAPIEGRDKEAARAGLFMYYGLVGLAGVGVVSLRRRRTTLIPLASVFLSVTLTAAYAYGTTRFRVPAEPALCVLAALGAIPILERLRRRFPANHRELPQPAPSTFVTGSTFDVRRAFTRGAIRSWIAVGAVLAPVLVALPALMRGVGATMEEGFMLVFPERVAKGDVANVDFLHLYGPGSLHLLAGWFELVGASLTTERLFGLAQHLLTISALYVLARPWGRKVAVSVGAIASLFVLTPIGLQALAWSGGLGLAAWCAVFVVRAIHRRRTRDHLIAGVVAGLTLTFRPDMVLAIGLVLAIASARSGRRRIVATLAGVVVGATSLWVHLVQAGPSRAIRGMLIEPVFDLRAGRALPRPPSWSHLDGALQIIAEKVAPSWPIPHVSESKQLFLWFFLLPITALFVLGCGVLARRRLSSADGAARSRSLVLIVVGALSVGLLPQAIQRPDSAHLLWVAAVPWPFMIPAVIEWMRIRRPTSQPTVRRLAAAIVMVVLVLIVTPSYTARTWFDLASDSLRGTKPEFEVRRGDRNFYLGDERPYLASREVIADLDRMSRPGERLFVGPVDLRSTVYSDAFFYHLFPELDPATYFIEMDPGIANAPNSRLADDVRSADWLILTRFWAGWIEPNDSTVFGSDAPNQVVENDFCLRGSYQYDLVRLYQKCATGDGVGPYDAPYRPEYDYAVEVRVPVPPRPDGTCTPTCNGIYVPEYAAIRTDVIEPE